MNSIKYKSVAILIILCIEPSAFARFISADPYFLNNPEECVASPIECNLYSYGANNPLKYVDTDGRKIEVSSYQKGETTYVNNSFTGILSNKSSLSLSPTQIKGIAKQIERGIESSF